ncbi:hypothetical protein U1Q18_014231, partial [Sarracenia purpurea var. burkii]
RSQQQAAHMLLRRGQFGNTGETGGEKREEEEREKENEGGTPPITGVPLTQSITGESMGEREAQGEKRRRLNHRAPANDATPIVRFGFNFFLFLQIDVGL